MSIRVDPLGPTIYPLVSAAFCPKKSKPTQVK
jgi:hypothetical protein